MQKLCVRKESLLKSVKEKINKELEFFLSALTHIQKDNHKTCDPDCPVQTPNRASGPKWGKNGRKMDFGPTEKKGEKWPKNGKMDLKWVKNGHFPIFRPFFPLFSVGPKSIFRPFFPFRPFFEQCQVVVFIADDLGFLGPGSPDLMTELCPPQDTA